MNRGAVAGLFRKELIDVSRNPRALIPVVLVTGIALVLPAHNEAATVAAKAVTAVETTAATMSRLGQSSQQIGDGVR